MEIEYIQGSKFLELTNNYYCNGDDIYMKRNTLINKEWKFIYTHNHFLDSLLKDIKNIDGQFVIISHNTDTNINSIEIPDNVIKIYAQNVNVLNDKLVSIPAGLENDRWYPHLRKKETIKNKINEVKKTKNLVYMNHNVLTNYDKRTKAYEAIKNKSWCTVQMMPNGCDFNNYVNNIYNHKFMICPEGHSIESHRLWETLYLKSIPIVERSVFTSFYKDLPISYIDDWREIDEKFLEDELNRINSKDWNLEKLDFNYWSKKILNT